MESVHRRDAALAAVLCAAALVELAVREPLAGSAVAALALLALAFASAAPVVATSVVAGALAVDAAAGGVLIDVLVVPLGAAIAACLLLGLHARTAAEVAVGAVVSVAAMTAANQLAGEEYPLLDDLVFFALLLGTPAIVGHLLRRRALLVDELEERGSALAIALDEQAAAAVAEERARLSIGVHDAIAHRVAEISLQAAGAERLAGDEPDRAREALGRIEQAGRAALDDIRATVGVLRAGDPDLSLAPPGAAGQAVPAAWAGEAQRPSTRSAVPGPEPRPPADSPSRADIAIAAAVSAAIAVEALTSTRLEGPALANVLGAAAIGTPLAWRRVHPLAAAAGAYGAAGVMTLLLTSPGLLVTPIVLLLLPPYAVAAHLPLRLAVVGFLVCLVGSVAVAPSALTGVIGALAWVAGRAVRERGLRAQELAAVNAELAQAGDVRAARARGEERLRIARDLHDAVAHRMTVIVLQAGAAQRVWGADPAAARVAVRALAEVARDTLGELRARLRQAEAEVTGFDDLDAVIARLRPLGVDVELARAVEVDRLDPELRRLVHDVLREALTNAARHAAPTTVRVAVRPDGDELLVEVADAGRLPGRAPGAGVDGTGTGLRGLAERVEAAGGRLAFGAAGAGFAVTARLPLREAVPA